MILLLVFFNIGILLFMVIFIYVIIGMLVFGNVKWEGEFNDVVNFEMFGILLLLLFCLVIGLGWNDIMDVLFLKFLDCDFNYMGFFYGNCGFFGVIIYLVSYVIVVFLVIVNMYIVIIFENVNCVYEIEDFCIIKENFDSYYIIWGMFVLDGKFYLFLDCFLEFVDFFEKLFKIF